MTRFSIALCCLMLLFSKASISAEKTAYVRILNVTPIMMRAGFEQNTSIEAIQRVVIYPLVTGRLRDMLVAKGTKVKKGDKLAVLIHDEQNAQVESAKADVEKTKAEFSNAKIELERYQRLKKEGFSTQQELDSKDTTYRSAKAEYDSAKSELKRLTVNRDYYTILASIDGTVLNDYSLTPGAMLSTSTPVVELANLETLKATFSVPESRFYTIHPGMYVTLRLDAIPKEEFRARIVRIDDYVDTETRTAGVEARLKNSSTGNRLRPGMFGRAFVIEQEVPDALVVPTSALRIQRAKDDNNELALYEDGLVNVVKVKTGISYGMNVQIVSGIKAGDKVITFGGNALKSGDPVQLMD